VEINLGDRALRRRIPHRKENGIDQKYCKSCDDWHKLDGFNRKSASFDGLETKCKACAQKKSSKFREKHPAYDKDYQMKNSDKLKEYKKEYYRKKKLIDAI